MSKFFIAVGAVCALLMLRIGIDSISWPTAEQRELDLGRDYL